MIKIRNTEYRYLFIDDDGQVFATNNAQLVVDNCDKQNIVIDLETAKDVLCLAPLNTRDIAAVDD